MPILDTDRHAFDGPSVLSWLLAQWNEDAGLTLIVLVEKGKGDLLAKKLRVVLARARHGMKEAGLNAKQFGMQIDFSPWTREDMSQVDALYIGRIMHQRHIFDTILMGSEAWNELRGKKDGI